MQILLADSGSTHTQWVLVDSDKIYQSWETIGLNPYFHDKASIEAEISNFLPSETIRPEEIYFYGSGCKAEENQKKISEVLNKIFPDSRPVVTHDLLGAARSLCQTEPGIVCILGTGSNSCVYDGKSIKSNNTSLGFVLGDEGSGAVLGKILMRDFLYQRLPGELQTAFSHEFHPEPFEILSQVYMKPFPNRYLARFTRFLHDHRGHEYVKTLLYEQFEIFLKRNVVDYREQDLAVHFMGSIGYHFRSELEIVLDQHGLKTGTITNDAMPGLIEFHRNILGNNS